MRGLVVFQVVVTSILLIGSLLQMQSIRHQQTIDYGYDTDGVMTARMGLMDGDYPTNDARKLFFDRLVRELGAHPEFEGVALTNRFRMVFSGSGPVEIEGREYKEKKDRLNANFEQITPGYFEKRSEEHTSELQSLAYLVCRLLLEKKKNSDPVAGFIYSHNQDTSEGHNSS